MRVLGAACVMLLVASGCGGASGAPPKQPVVTPKVSPKDGDRSGFAGKPITLHRSDRLGIHVPLPDAPAWRIVDTEALNSGWFVATHALTQTVVRARRFDDVAPIVGRKECEQRAVVAGELPSVAEIEKRGFETLTDEALHRPKGWDGRRWVAFEPGPLGLAGHVFLLAGRGRACLVVHVVAKVHGDGEADVLADRLELFSSRVVGGVVADNAGAPTTPLPTLP